MTIRKEVLNRHAAEYGMLLRPVPAIILETVEDLAEGRDTAPSIAAARGLAVHTARLRLAQARAAGFAVFGGQRPADSGQTAHVFELTGRGRALVMLMPVA